MARAGQGRAGSRLVIDTIALAARRAGLTSVTMERCGSRAGAINSGESHCHPPGWAGPGRAGAVYIHHQGRAPFPRWQRSEYLLDGREKYTPFYQDTAGQVGWCYSRFGSYVH